MLSLLSGIRGYRKSVKKVQFLREVVGEEILRNSMAYAFEIGAGSPLLPALLTSPNNPFMDNNWRSKVVEN